MTPTIDEFVAARGEALLRFALMLCGNRHSAEDLVQSALAMAYPRWARISAMERPEAYVKKVIVREHLRWRRRRSSGEVPLPGSAGEGRPTVDDVAGAHADRDAAWALLARLPRGQRAILVVRYYEDLSDGQIAAMLGCGESTVRSQAARGIAASRAALPTLERETLP